jgi:very-short-patch-repair endonuclease
VSRAPLIPAALTTGPFNLEEARRHGLTKDHLLGASWRRLGGGVYALRAIANDPDVVLAATRRRLSLTAVFSGRTAGWLHGLELPPCDPVEVTLPSGSHTSRLAGIVVRRSELGASETVTRRGHPTTSVVRTIADLGRHRPLVEGVAALDMALHRRLLQSDALRSWASAHPRYPGIARLRRAIELAEPATESVMETRLRLLLVMARLPRPLAQVRLYDEAGDFLGRPDVYYPLHHLAIEYDGAQHRENLTADNRRQNRLVDAGYRLLRFTAPDVLSAPDSVVALVRRALSAGPNQPRSSIPARSGHRRRDK